MDNPTPSPLVDLQPTEPVYQDPPEPPRPPLLKSQEVAGIQDILSCICHHLRFQHDDTQATKSQDRKSMLQVVLSFKAMYEPAVNALWHTLPSIAPLLRLLSCVSRSSSEYALIDATTSWYRLDFYAVRVRALVLEDDPRGQTISPYLVSFIDNARQTPLLPGLRFLHIPPNVSFSECSMFSVVSPSLQALKISTRYRTSFSIALLHLVRSICNELSHLEITDGDSANVVRSIPYMKLKRLELHIPDQTLPFSFLPNLTSRLHTSLNYVAISARDIEPMPAAPLAHEDSSSGTISTGQMGGRIRRPAGKKKKLGSSAQVQFKPFKFDNLATIKLMGDLNGVLNTLSWHAHNLHHLTIDLAAYTSLAKSKALPKGLISLHINDNLHGRYDSGGGPFQLSTLIEAPSVHILERLTFSPDTTVSTLTDSTLELLSRSLPQLKILVLPLNVSDGQYPTTDGLVSLATCCSHLETLHIPLQSISAPANTITTSLHARLTCLRIYTDRDPGAPLLSSTIGLARNFHRHFPDLKTLDTYGSCSSNTVETCRSIKELLYFLRDMAT